MRCVNEKRNELNENGNDKDRRHR
jgi:hypothetical protein